MKNKFLQRNTYSAFDFSSVQLTRLAICKKTTGDVFIHFYPDLILDALLKELSV